MVYYRTYRPQTISQLDSEVVRNALTAALAAKTVPHAFLFTGPKGLGKTSAARIVAKAVNCERKSKAPLRSEASKSQKLENVEPCNRCSQCISITEGMNLDVLEIDGASNRGIDEIRDLREKLRLTPIGARKKVYIIDEVHMLTTEAFNALLKTLEEPPAHVHFVLCTTEPHKVPSTIVSRCFHVPFTLATEVELVRSFKRIAKGEELKIDEDVFFEIAKLSDRSFRDGAKILEELVSHAQGKKITKKLAQEKYHTSTMNKSILELLHYMVNKDSKGSLVVVSELVKNGVDMKYFIEQLITQLHELLLAKVGVKTDRKIEDGEWKVEEIKELVQLLTKAHGELKYAVLPQLPLELVVVEWAQQAHSSSTSTARGPVTGFPPASARSSLASSNELRAVGSPPTRATPRSSNLLEQLTETVKKHNHSIAGVLRGCTVRQEKGTLVIETKYKFHKERLSEQKTLHLLEKVSGEITGKKSRVVVELVGR